MEGAGSVPASLRAILSARTEEAPMLMLAKGPACTKTGVPSRVCMRLGLMASFMRAVMAPAAPMSSQVMGSAGVRGRDYHAPEAVAHVRRGSC